MSILDRVPLDAIAARAERIRFVPTLLSLCALPLMALGYLVRGGWVAVKWCCAAFMVTFNPDGPTDRGPHRRGSG